MLPILGAVLGGLIVLLTLASSKGAPQEAAGFAFACATAIIPYVFTRAVLAMRDDSIEDAASKIVNAIHASSQYDAASRRAGRAE